MCKLRQFMNTNTLKNIYYSLLYSHLVYSIQVWGSACISEINKILVLQKRALRIVTRNNTFPSVPGQRACGFLYFRIGSILWTKYFTYGYTIVSEVICEDLGNIMHIIGEIWAYLFL